MYPSDDFDSGANGVNMRFNDTTIEVDSHNPSLRVYNCAVDVVRPVRVTTSTGQAETTVVLATDWQCAITWKSGVEKILFDKDTYFQDAVLICRVIPGVVVKVSDRIVYRGDVFEIVDVRDISNLGRRYRIAIKRIV